MNYHIVEVLIIKKIIAVIISLGLLLALSSCFRFGPKTASPSPSAVSSPEASPSADASAEASTLSETPETSSAPASDSEPSDTDTGAGPRRGVWDENAYSNDFFNLHFTAPEGWIVATDEEIANVMGIGADAMGGDKDALMDISKMTTIYDMMVQDPVTGSNVIIMFENLSMSVGGTRLDEAEYLDILKKQMDNLEGMKYTFDEPYDTTLGSDDYLAAHAAEAINGISQYYLLHKQESYMVIIVVSLNPITEISDILAQFK